MVLCGSKHGSSVASLEEALFLRVWYFSVSVFESEFSFAFTSSLQMQVAFVLSCKFHKLFSWHSLYKFRMNMFHIFV